MDSANAVSVPADMYTILKKNMSNNDQSNFIPYCQLIDVCTDIMFIVSNLNQFLEQPSCIERQQNVLKYLKGTLVLASNLAQLISRIY